MSASFFVFSKQKMAKKSPFSCISPKFSVNIQKKTQNVNRYINPLFFHLLYTKTTCGGSGEMAESFRHKRHFRHAA